MRAGIRLQLMRKAKKVIENYQILQTLQEYENQYEILLARHTTDKQLYVLKKLSIKEGNNQALYEGLLNQAKLLKLLNQQNIVRCFRMLKTSNNIYLAFSYLEGSSLAELIQGGPKSLTLTQKESIAKQLCLALSELQKNSIAHLNITPQNIMVSADGAIMLKEFLYAMEIPEEGEVDVIRKVPKSLFLAPETRRGIACFEADIYSMGKVLEKMDFRKNKKQEGDNMRRAQELADMVQAMVAKDRANRLLLTEVYQSLFPHKKKVKRLRSLSQSGGMASSRLSRASSISGHSSMSSSKSQFGSKQIYSDILLKIMRHRGMSWLLVRLMQRVVQLRVGSEWAVMLSVLFLKKSTKLLASLGKYLHYGKNDIGLQVAARDQARFFKTTDYHKVCQIVDKEIALQRKQLDLAIEAVYVNNVGLLKRADFSREFKEEITNQPFLQKCITQFIREAVKANLSEQALFDLYLMSLIVYFHGIQEFFRQRVLPQPMAFEQQIFIKKAKEMPKDKMLESLLENLEPKHTEI